jgi:PAS domain S-box-containing protein
MVELQKARDELEQRVTERTAELTTANLSLQQEIVERQQVEQTLAAERNLLRTLIDNLPHYIYYKDAQARFIITNAANARVLRIETVSDAIGKSDLDFYPKQLAEQYYADDMSVIESGQPLLNREEMGLDENGERKWILTTKLPLHNKQGQVIGLVGIGIDITQRKQTEQALRESEEAMRQLADGAFEGIVIHDEGMIIEANHAFCRMFEYEHAEIINKSVLDFTISEHRELLHRKIISGDVTPFEIMGLRKDDSHFHMEVVCRPIIYRGRAVRIGTIQDVTERKLGESRRLELAYANQKAEILREFLNTVSHDLKTPLTVINTSLYLLERATDPIRQKEKLEQIKTQAERLEKLIQDILTVSRLDTIPEMIAQLLDLNQVMGKVREQFNTVAEKQRLTIDMELDRSLPPILANEVELHRAMVNLVENALHYTPPQGQITIRTFGQVDEAIIEVSDTGIGIDDTDLPHIFEHFYRADKARTTDKGGTGLGLAIVKKIIEMHHGSIEVESLPGQGSTFRVKLPAYQTTS